MSLRRSGAQDVLHLVAHIRHSMATELEYGGIIEWYRTLACTATPSCRTRPHGRQHCGSVAALCEGQADRPLARSRQEAVYHRHAGQVAEFKGGGRDARSTWRGPASASSSRARDDGLVQEDPREMQDARGARRNLNLAADCGLPALARRTAHRLDPSTRSTASKDKREEWARRSGPISSCRDGRVWRSSRRPRRCQRPKSLRPFKKVGRRPAFWPRSPSEPQERRAAPAPLGEAHGGHGRQFDMNPKTFTLRSSSTWS